MLKDRSPLQHFPLLLSFPLCRQQCAGCRGRSQQSTVGCYHHTSADQGDHGAASRTTHYTHSAMLRGHRCRGREYSVLSLCEDCDYVRHVLVARVREQSNDVVRLPNTCYDPPSTMPPWSRWGWSTDVLQYRGSKHQILL